MEYEAKNLELYNLYQETNDNNYLEQLYNSNMKLFYKICAKFPDQEKEDLLQECFLGLIKAVNTYSIEKGIFSLFLAKVITWHLFRYAKSDNLVSVPEYLQTLVKRYLYLKDGEKRTDQEICILLDLEAEELENIKKAISVSNIRRNDFA